MTRIRFGRLAVAGLAVALTFALDARARAQSAKSQNPEARARAEYAQIEQMISKYRRITFQTANAASGSAGTRSAHVATGAAS